jgi:DNA polymerase-3 subunit delta'
MPELTASPLPWQQSTWERLRARYRAGQMPHALLIHGPAGVGKRRLAEALAQSVLCANPALDGAGCGACGACRLYQAGTHPDLLRVELLEDKKEIVVDQIRELREFAALRSHGGGYKVVLVDPAERMNVNAANALLKTLEEPGGATLILLITTRPNALLPTVRSRCQRVECPVPPRAQALTWLRQNVGGDAAVEALLDLAGGAPLRAVALHAGDALKRHARVLEELSGIAAGEVDPSAVAERWAKADKDDALAWTGDALADLARLKFDAAPSLLTNIGSHAALAAMAPQIDMRGLFDVLDRVRYAQTQANSGLNQQLLLEDALIAWEHHCARGMGRNKKQETARVKS